MESTTKNRQPLDVLRTLVGRAYGDAAIPAGDDFAEELTDGWFNVIYRITLADGRPVILKIAPPADVQVLTREVGMMRAELEAMRLVATHTEVPIPRIDHVDLTHEVVDADLFFMECIAGHNLGFAASEHLSAEEIYDANRRLGALNRQITEVAGERFGALDGEGFATWRDAFLAMVDDTLADGVAVGIDLGHSPEAVRAVFAAHADALDDVTEPRLTEVDLWDKNSMIRDGKIVAILDHERAIWGDPIMEAGFTGLDIPIFGDPQAFMEGFGLTTLTPSERTRRRLYSLYLAVIMTVETKYRGHTTTEVYDMAREQMDLIMAALRAESQPVS
ncbi:phosphotransferase family protein [Demequina litorisediminis]|uniref:Aminoglycoside phosphotransferase n=1 Tax=Demequina litorisediminis TaxID=1849022 RepID=A0ABQ6IAE2_9MICO|nr:aminoglycoside phosphotransferase family protein [Demequina litorisediminis]GMA34795.1 aminoglycoside phosphotransferase [Demequina litorisediminis]